MSETTEPENQAATPLTDYALQRLRILATGNGIDPLKIIVKSGEEKTVTLTGTVRLTPKAEVQTQRLSGPKLKLPKSEKNFNTFAELAHYVAEEQKNFNEGKDWFQEVQADLDKLPGKGWGMQDAWILFDNKPKVYYTAAETCTLCLGQGGRTCEYCAGRTYLPCHVCSERGTELCYMCYGQGRNPSDPNTPCPTCHGSRFAICRTCQGRKGLPCGNCRATGIITCSVCNGGGRLVELTAMSFGADAVFAPGSSAELPAAIRRAFDRVGLKMLTNGHADIDYTKPADEDQKPGEVALNYTAKMDVADLVVHFDKLHKRIAIFGQKRTMLEVPAFLDEALAPGFRALRQVARGKSRIANALEYRALREAFELILSGKTGPEHLHKIYPLGLSKPFMQKIMQTMRLAIGRVTRMARIVGFCAALVLAMVLGSALYLTPLHATVLTAGGITTAWALEAFVPVFCAVMGYVLTGQAALLHLRRTFPLTKAVMHHHGGTLGLVAAVICFVIPCVIALLHPQGVQWLKALPL